MFISQDSHEKEIRLSGLLFFHPISDNRMGGSPIKHLKMLHNLCGVETLKNVVLVTTMWDQVDEEEGDNRENELTARYWKTMIELGCRTSRFDNNTESALDIVSQFQDARCTVLLQRIAFFTQLTRAFALCLPSALISFFNAACVIGSYWIYSSIRTGLFPTLAAGPPSLLQQCKQLFILVFEHLARN